MKQKNKNEGVRVSNKVAGIILAENFDAAKRKQIRKTVRDTIGGAEVVFRARGNALGKKYTDWSTARYFAVYIRQGCVYRRGKPIFGKNGRETLLDLAR